MSMGMFTSKSLNAYCQLFHRNFAPIYIPSTLHKGTLKTLFGFCLKKKKQPVSGNVVLLWNSMKKSEVLASVLLLVSGKSPLIFVCLSSVTFRNTSSTNIL